MLLFGYLEQLYNNCEQRILSVGVSCLYEFTWGPKTSGIYRHICSWRSYHRNVGPLDAMLHSLAACSHMYCLSLTTGVECSKVDWHNVMQW